MALNRTCDICGTPMPERPQLTFPTGRRYDCCETCEAKILDPLPPAPIATESTRGAAFRRTGLPGDARGVRDAGSIGAGRGNGNLAPAADDPAG